MNFIEPETLPIELRQAITHRNLEEGEELFTQGEQETIFMRSLVAESS